MQIVQVDLENVKSYSHASVPFALGTNSICGLNGAGKSTLLEAVGFALFDYLAVPQAEFVREGERTATVTVHVVGEDDRLYRVTRRCGGANQYSVYDPELDLKVADGKAETLSWLRDFLGLDEAGDPSSLFRDAVGVPQGLLTAAFLDRPANRKNTFGPLLRVDEYDLAWSNLREPRRRLEQLVAGQDTRIAGLEVEVRDLPTWRAKVDEVAAALASTEGRQAAATEELAGVAERKMALETLKAQIDDLRAKEAVTAGKVQMLAARIEEAQAALRRAVDAQDVVTETESGHLAYLSAQEELTGLEGQRRQREELREKHQVFERDLVKSRANLDRLIADLADVGRAERQMESLRPEVAVQEQIEADLREARLATDRLKTAARTLEREQERLTEMRARLVQVRAGLTERETVSAELVVLRADLDPLDTRWETINAELVGWLTEREGLVGQQKDAMERIRLAARALDREQQQLRALESKLAEVQAGLDKRKTTGRETAELTQALQELAEQITMLAEHKAAQEAVLAQVKAQVEVLAATEAPNCPVCEAPLTPQHRSDLLERYQQRQSNCEAELAKAKTEQQAAERARRGKQKTLQELEELLRTLPRVEEEESLLAQMAVQQNAIAESEASVAREEEAASGIQKRLTELEIVLDGLQRERGELETRRLQLQRERDKRERRLLTLPRPDEADDLEEQIQRQEASVAANQHAVDALAGAPEEAERLEAKLVTLGDPRRAYQRAADVAARRAGLETEQTALTAGIAKLEEDARQLQQELDAFLGLDDAIERVRTTLSGHDPAHQRYLQHFREAQATDQRRTALSGLEEQHRIAEANRDAVAAEITSLQAQFDVPALADLTKRHGDLRELLAGLEVEVREQRRQQSEAVLTVQRLQAMETNLAEARAERTELQDTLGLLDKLRQVLHDAGPQLTRALVEVISIQADRVYAEIMQDFGSRLRWAEDYDILLSNQGRNRSFQQLSGGEQMAAALAVRLALLREVSSIDVAFFDEPTANLDRDRRANLARQILNVKGFTQLFVISHDDTFEQDTDHVVRIEKRNGASHVEA